MIKTEIYILTLTIYIHFQLNWFKDYLQQVTESVIFIDDSRVIIWCLIIFLFVCHYDIEIVECTSWKVRVRSKMWSVLHQSSPIPILQLSLPSLDVKLMTACKSIQQSCWLNGQPCIGRVVHFILSPWRGRLVLYSRGAGGGCL